MTHLNYLPRCEPARGWFFFVLALALALAVPCASLADSPPVSPNSAVIPGPHPGAAGAAGEAPGSGHLAPAPEEPREGTTAADRVSPGAQNAPADSRSMAFEAGGGPVCREAVPGGPMLAIAYAIALLIMGAYVARLALKNVQLTAAIHDLEAEIHRHKAAPPGNNPVSLKG